MTLVEFFQNKEKLLPLVKIDENTNLFQKSIKIVIISLKFYEKTKNILFLLIQKTHKSTPKIAIDLKNKNPKNAEKQKLAVVAHDRRRKAHEHRVPGGRQRLHVRHSHQHGQHAERHERQHAEDLEHQQKPRAEDRQQEQQQRSH